MNFLVSFKEIDLNIQDNEGLTALHLGAMSGNQRIIKRLLIKGCDKRIADRQNELASDKARQNEFRNIEKLLLEENGYWVSYMNIRVNLEKMKRSKS